ncbi:Holliday junction resolvase RusA (prophage-encoded endonuclease) [Carboxydocella sporoproducens DSM 16521]|uniref:Holliday junction resolvase RusA (Prophage-encoded endonuclease) n=2 Tax=Carboxydocella TaxID=178898 RepID=A0A1T4QF39_9FIRM|nr:MULTISPECIES: RusA family crossover junction endodeoxyribonuclease [Carboxydocella]AVX21616.1 Holliday junction resolvase RusA (prophage-encoded endonuclease) [Carboxydocella thermautotrophica]SKA02121.1 Holliday junction resolvase RusA (prophage-encoded endonuclease) [Carboxydocella sporoproducens DSM 16521]
MSCGKEVFEFVVPGRPVPAVRMTQRGKFVKERAQQYLAYKEAVAWYAVRAGVRRINGPVAVEIIIHLADKKAGDWDNYGKAITDALNKVAYKDDRQIVDGRVIKRLCDKGEERAEVRIWKVEEVEQCG